MSSLNPQTLYNENTPIFVLNPIKSSGLDFTCSTIGGPTVTLVNNNGVLESYTNGSNANIFDTASWANYPAINGYIDMAPGGLQRITATNSQLYYNGQALASGGNVADWSYFPVDSGYIDFASDGSERLTATSTTLIYNGVALTGGAIEDWSLYSSITNVQMVQHNIENTADIYTNRLRNNYNQALTIQADRGSGNGMDVNINATNHLNLNSDSATVFASPQTIITAGYLSRPDLVSLVDINTSNGLYGQINLTANPGFIPIGNNGAINLTANGGTDLTGSVGFGGNISIIANSPITVPSATSAIKVNASCVLSYAGFVPIIGSIAGVNFIYGSAGVSITSDVLGPLVGPVPGCIYMKGLYGTEIDTSVDAGGNRYGLYCSDYQPFADVDGNTRDLLLKGRGNYSLINGPQIGNVNLENVATINGNIYTYISGTDVSLSPSLQITGLSTINGNPYQPIGTTNVDLSGYSILNCANLQVSSINTLQPVPPLIYLTYVDPFGYVLTDDTKNLVLFEKRYTVTSMTFQYTTISDDFYVRLISDSIGRTVVLNGQTKGYIEANTVTYLTYTNGDWLLYGPSDPWYLIPAQSDVDMNSKNMLNASSFQGISFLGSNVITSTITADTMTASTITGSIANISSITADAITASTITGSIANISSITAGAMTVSTINGLSYPSYTALIFATTQMISDADWGRTFVIGGRSYSTFDLSGSVSPGWYCFLKNGSRVSGYVDIAISVNGTAVSGFPILFSAPHSSAIPPLATGNSQMCILIWNGLVWSMY